MHGPANQLQMWFLPQQVGTYQESIERPPSEWFHVVTAAHAEQLEAVVRRLNIPHVSHKAAFPLSKTSNSMKNRTPAEHVPSCQAFLWWMDQYRWFGPSVALMLWLMHFTAMTVCIKHHFQVHMFVKTCATAQSRTYVFGVESLTWHTHTHTDCTP